MRTADERVSLLHKRAAELKRQREKRYMALWGGVSAFLSVFLLILISQVRRVTYPIENNRFAGSSLLGESAGGFVLVALIAFTGGVVITLIIQRHRERGRKNRSNQA